MDAGLGEDLVNLTDEFLEVGEDLLGGFAEPEVVLTTVEDDGLGLVAGYDDVEVVEDVGNMRTSESAIEDFAVRKVLVQTFPHADARAAREEGEVGGGFSFGIILLEGDHGLGEAGGIGPLLGVKHLE